jgi:hypothetical protein
MTSTLSHSHSNHYCAFCFERARRMKCPTCGDERPLQLPTGMAAAAVSTPAAWLRCIPQSSVIIEAIRRSQQLEARLKHAQSQQPRCSYPACAAAAVKWCEECGSEMCEAHDASWHSGGSRSTHKRIPLADRAAVRQERMAAVMTAEANRLRATARSALLQREKTVKAKGVSLDSMRTSHSQAQGHLRLEFGMKLMQMKAEQSLMQKQAEADLATERAALPQLRDMLNRLNQMSDADTIAQEAALNALLKSAQSAARSPVATPLSQGPMCVAMSPDTATSLLVGAFMRPEDASGLLERSALNDELCFQLNKFIGKSHLLVSSCNG